MTLCTSSPAPRQRRARPGARRVIHVSLLLALACCTAVTPRSAHADDEPSRMQLFESANAAFAAGRFAEARQGFAELIAHDGPSPAVLYNLGNAAFRDGRVGEAIVSYERALQLAPRDQDIRANLRQVRKAAGLAEPEDGLWTRLVRALTGDAWAWLASAWLYLACAVLLLRRLGASTASRQARSALALALAASLVLLAVAAAACATRLGERDRAVVLDGDPVLRVAPYASATASSELAPGDIVRIERSHDGFTLVRTAAGRSGWMSVDALARIDEARE